MEADHCEATAGRQPRERRVERGLQFGELAIDVNAQRLEHAGGRMLVALLAAGDARDHLGELGRALERPHATILHDGARDARRQALFAVLAKDSDELGQRRAVDDIGGALPRTRRHAHVERTVLQETEAALGVIELRGGDAQIEQDAVELEPRLDLVGTTRQCGKRGEENRHAGIPGEAQPCVRNGG
jgi:hypothetical protein